MKGVEILFLALALGMAFVASAGPVAFGEFGILRAVPDAALGFLIGFLPYLGVREVGRTKTDPEPSSAQDPSQSGPG